MRGGDAFELNDLVSLCVPIAAQWREVGLELRLSQGTLDVIQANNAGSPNQIQLCLLNMLTWWMNNNPYPSKDQVIKAVAAVSLRNMDLTRISQGMTSGGS